MFLIAGGKIRELGGIWGGHHVLSASRKEGMEAKSFVDFFSLLKYCDFDIKISVGHNFQTS